MLSELKTWFLEKWFVQAKIEELEGRAFKARSMAASYESINASRADLIMNCQPLPEEAFYKKESARLEEEIRRLRSTHQPTCADKIFQQ